MPRKNKKSRRSIRQKEMAALVSQYESCSETLRAFCDRNGIAMSTFRYWLDKYGSTPEPSLPESSDFIALQVRREDLPAIPAQQFVEPAAHLSYPDGTELRLGPGVSPEFLKSLLPIFQTL